jgi:hypothetical protein
MARDGLDYLGCDEVVGFDYGTLFQTAGGLMQGIADQTAEDQAKDKATAEEDARLYAATQADITASNSAAQAAVSAKLKSPSMKKDAVLAAAAAAAQDAAGVNLSDASVKKRLDAANAMLANAKKNAAAKPNDGYLAAVVKGWTATVQKLQNSGGSADKSKKGGGESFWTRRVIGPIPGTGVVVGGVGLLAGLGIVVKKIFFK